ncbi:hypothetical protein HPB49_015134 [Dermacentor silvarum]|uniref:Uncharacterized protein n=1 Tax=Dermacentor silvarum TaxID=543639 RepID=A0ACB8D6D4_DERSI|nr:hypothetical protein HPB49_015134 [Dermacentor silvarum]
MCQSSKTAAREVCEGFGNRRKSANGTHALPPEQMAGGTSPNPLPEAPSIPRVSRRFPNLFGLNSRASLSRPPLVDDEPSTCRRGSEVPYDEELDKIAALDDSVQPEELRDGYGIVSRKDTGTVSNKKGSSSGEAEKTPDGTEIDEELQSSQSNRSSSPTGSPSPAVVENAPATSPSSAQGLVTQEDLNACASPAVQEFLKTPGILDEVFVALKEKVTTMAPNERHACVLMDEMQISPGLDYDASIGSIIGQPTIGLSNPALNDELASHALVFMFGGLTSRWKQAVAYHFTGSSFDAQQVNDCLFELVQRAEAAGMIIDEVITDMGPENMAIWRLCNIQATKYGKPHLSCPHPCGDNIAWQPCGHNRQLYFIADAPYLLKNLRGHLVRGQDIILDQATVAKNTLPCNKVSLEHARKACEIDAGHKLKLLPHLRLRDLDPNHYEKMNVASAPCHCRSLTIPCAERSPTQRSTHNSVLGGNF